MRSFLAAGLALFAAGSACGDFDSSAQTEASEKGGMKDPEPLSQAEDEIHNGTTFTTASANKLGVVSVRIFRWKEGPSIAGGFPQEDKEGQGGFGSNQGGYCSGLIYKKQWVITAKHCWVSDMNAPLGVQNFFGAEIFDASIPKKKSLAKSYKVSVHPDLDIAVVHLSTSACQKGDTTSACTGVSISRAIPDEFKSLKISHVDCVGYADLKRGDAMPTSGRFLVDLNVNAKDFVDAKLRTNPLFSTVQEKSIEDQKKWWKQQTCEGSRQLIGLGCVYSINPLSDLCQNLGTFDETKCLPPRPVIAKGDSGGPCFENSVKSRSLVGITANARRDDRTGNGTILNDATSLGFAWPWLAEQGLLPPPTTPQTPAQGTNIPDLSVFGKSSHFLINLGSNLLFDFVTVSSDKIFWARNNGNGLDPFKTIASELIDPSSSYFFDFDQDGSYELIWMKSNEFKIRKPNVLNGTLQDFQPDILYKLPFVAEGPWSEATSFLLPIFGTPYYGIARIDENLLRFIPWNPDSGFDVLQKVELFLNEKTSVPSFQQVDFLYLDTVDDFVDFVGFNTGKLVIKAGILTGNLGLPAERTITDDCKTGAFKTMIDLNNDGRADYLCIDRNSIRSWIATSSDFQFQLKPFTTPFELVREWNDNVSLVDIDLDGILDVVVSFQTKSYEKDKLGFISRRVPSVYVMYHLGKGDGSFDSTQFVSISEIIAKDAAASGSSNLISSVAEIESNKGNDTLFVGNKHIWLQPQIVNPKINTSGTSSAKISPWRKLIWKKNNLQLERSTEPFDQYHPSGSFPSVRAGRTTPLVARCRFS